LAGATRPKKAVQSSSASFNSAKVGTSGSTGRRCRDDTASGRNLPACTSVSDVGRLSNITWIWPPTASCSAGPTPRYGT
jgi:hypothetical protein